MSFKSFNKVLIISGPQGSGKTLFVEKIIELIRSRGLTVAGIIAHGYWENNERTGFELEDLLSGKKAVLCRTIPARGWQKFRRFYFNPAGFEFGKKALEPEYVKHTDIIAIDEVGPLELEGKGWDEPIKKLSDKINKPVMLTVREGLVNRVVEHYGIKDFSVIKTGDNSFDRIENIGFPFF